MPSNQYRTGYIATGEEGANLIFSELGRAGWAIHYKPAPQANEIATHVDNTYAPPASPLLLVEAHATADLLITYPLNTTASSKGFLQPKYAKLRTITFEGFEATMEGFDSSLPANLEDALDVLRGLPSGFIRDPFFGLGVRWDLRYLTSAVEEVGAVTDLRIRRGSRTGLPAIVNHSYVLTAKMFDDARRAINRAHERALAVAAREKRAFAHNTLLTTVDPIVFPRQERTYRKDAIVEAIGKSLDRNVALSAADQAAVVTATNIAARTISRTKRSELLELSRKIELVTLETLIERFKAMLSRNLKETIWQDFFVNNQFVLQLAFGLPIMKVGDNISVGGRKFSGAGDKITDFAVKAVVTGNLSLVEIKTPQSILFEKTPYRGGLYAPSRELTGAVNQILDQRYQLQKSISLFKDNSGISDVETYAVQGLIIAGRTPDTKDKLKSLELFRNALNSITVVMFDELLLKLEYLLEALAAPFDPANGGHE